MSLVLRNIALVPSSRPNTDILYALLLLSYVSSNQVDDCLSRTPDTLEAASRAMTVAMKLGLDGKAHGLMGWHEPLGMQALLDQTVLVGSNLIFYAHRD